MIFGSFFLLLSSLLPSSLHLFLCPFPPRHLGIAIGYHISHISLMPIKKSFGAYCCCWCFCCCRLLDSLLLGSLVLLVAAIVFVVGSFCCCLLAFLLQSWLQASSLLLLSFVVVDCWAVLCCLLLEALSSLSSVFLMPCFVFVLHLCLLVARVLESFFLLVAGVVSFVGRLRFLSCLGMSISRSKYGKTRQPLIR